MPINILGTVVLDGTPQSDAKVYISNYQGKITPKRIGTVTNAEGKFVLDIEGKDDNYLSASTGAGNITTTMLNNDVNNYTLDLSISKSTSKGEVVVKPKESKPKESKPEENKQPVVKKTNWLLIGLIGLGVLVAGSVTYYLVKRK
jgi:hypothetical protein